ncbi:MAG: nucleotidyl transferase AbiEii/AbiGii toxin family protein [Mediterraneibacter sp.]|mgnify:FL=1
MIHTSKQLKDKVRNISHGDNEIAQVMIRNFIMERFLERVSLSKYKKNIILKGGMLVASLVGIETRATMDIDTTVKALPLNKEDTVKIINDIINISVEDGINFRIAKVTGIMTEFEYPGVRVALEATLDRLKQRIKIDISTDDVIIPSAISYNYRLMFEERSIELMTYTTETLLAEKIQTILARGITTTRMRDFYDVYELVNGDKVNVERRLLLEAFSATCAKRKTVFNFLQMERTLQEIRGDKGLEKLWELYRKDNFYVGDMKWPSVCETVCTYISEELAKRT